MTIKENISLLPYNTFGIDVKARLFIEYYSLDELRQVLKEHKGEQILHIGQGSNLLFTRDFNGVIESALYPRFQRSNSAFLHGSCAVY